jgi:hypothetical protein
MQIMSINRETPILAFELERAHIDLQGKKFGPNLAGARPSRVNLRIAENSSFKRIV